MNERRAKMARLYTDSPEQIAAIGGPAFPFNQGKPEIRPKKRIKWLVGARLEHD